MKGKIAEIFESIQGEGLYFGERQIFVRFFGCNLDCRFCDTKLKSYKEYDPYELLQEIKGFGADVRSVSFTGGEPLLQKDFLGDLLKLTAQAGYKNYLETNGTLPEYLKEVIADVDIVAMDIKLPSSTGERAFWDEHDKFLKISLQKEFIQKIIICNSTAESEFRQALDLINNNYGYGVLVLQPNSFEYDTLMEKKLEEFRGICVQQNITVCVIPQMHKLMGVG